MHTFTYPSAAHEIIEFGKIVLVGNGGPGPGGAPDFSGGLELLPGLWARPRDLVLLPRGLDQALGHLRYAQILEVLEVVEDPLDRKSVV